MEGCFSFQWGLGLFFRWGWCPMGGVGFDGGGEVRKKLLDGEGAAPPCPHPTMGNPVMGGLNLKFVKILWGQNFFICLWGEVGGHKSLWGEVIFITTSSLFQFFRKNQHPEK